MHWLVPHTKSTEIQCPVDTLNLATCPVADPLLCLITTDAFRKQKELTITVPNPSLSVTAVSLTSSDGNGECISAGRLGDALKPGRRVRHSAAAPRAVTQLAVLVTAKRQTLALLCTQEEGQDERYERGSGLMFTPNTVVGCVDLST